MVEDQQEKVSEALAGGQRPFQAPVPPAKKLWQRRPLIVLILLAIVIIAAGAWLALKPTPQSDDINQTEQDSTEQTVEEPKTHLQMLATGDWIAHDAINKEAKQADGSYDYAPMLEPFKNIFAESDINFCNQATIAGGEQFGITGYPVFNAPFDWTRDMKGIGCNVINVGTNHTNDKGQRAITAMLDEWDKQDVLAVAGANRSTEEQAKVRYFEVEGVKFAFLSYSTYSNIENPNPYSLNRFTDELVVPQMTEARLQADIVIVSMRWGTEYSETINVAQTTQAQKLADLGADIVLGHGTHTLQPVKRLQGTLPDGSSHEAIVWFGLGNFLNAQLETTGLTGCVATFSIEIASKSVAGSDCLSFYQHYEWTAEQKAAEDLLARKNFRIMPLYDAEDYLSKSLLSTTVEAQMSRIQTLVNQFTKIPVLDSAGL